MPQLQGGDPQVDLDGIMGAIFDTVATQGAVPIVINQEWMTGHRAAFVLIITLIAKPRLTGIDAEMPVGAQLQG